MDIKEKLKSNYFVRCSYYLLDDYLNKFRSWKGVVKTNSGTTHIEKEVDESIAYIREVFNDYKYYAGVERFYGRVAEVGPGDNSGVAMLFIEDGCESVDLADRFYSARNAFRQENIYKELLTLCPMANAKLSSCKLSDEETFTCISRHYGNNASAEQFFFNNGSYDFIVSRAVFEHTYDPLMAISRILTALRPGGMLLHKIDLRDHGMFSSHFHELKFLEVPEFIYRRMTRFSGRPNRILVDSYRNLMDKLDVDHKILVTRLAGVGEISPHIQYDEIPESVREDSIQYVRSVRKYFASSLSHMTDADLSVTGIFLVGTR